MSNMLIPTLREPPREAEIPSHRLMLRSGLIRKIASGIYCHLTLGQRTLKKIKNIVREEMNRQDGQEVSFSALQPAEIWKESGRWAEYGPEMFKLTDRNQREFCLGPTHEEVFTDLIRNEISSYRDLPLLLYQIQTKYRDEIRPRFGVMRSREFIMKDLYSFDRDQDGLDTSYQKMYEAYSCVFKRCGLDTVVVEADTGAMGGTDSHEFMVKAQEGEAEIATCAECGYAANVERAESAPMEDHDSSFQNHNPIEEVTTPGITTVEDLQSFLDLPTRQMIKTLIYVADDEPVAVLVRGDDELNDVKLKNHLSVHRLEMADGELIQEVTGAPLGFSGPVGFDDLQVIADHRVMDLKDAVTGGNKKDRHFIHVVPGRDFQPDAVCDLRVVQAGDPCPECRNELETMRGIEVGHIFKLGTKYSESLNATYLNEEGESQPIIMGSYGIGIDRCMAAIVEQFHDEDGICWPISVAPFEVVILPLDLEGEVWEKANTLYNSLQEAGVEVVIDNREERAGVKFNDADLIGFPLRVTLGSRSVNEGKIEVRIRKSGKDYKVDWEQAEKHIIQVIERLKVELAR